MLNTVKHALSFKREAACGDRTGPDNSQKRVTEAVLRPGSINQPLLQKSSALKN